MKHIGWCLEQIQIVMSNMPGELKSKEDEDKARFILARVQEYAEILAKLILHPKFKKSLHELEKVPIEGIRLQAHEVEELLKDLEHSLYIISLAVNELLEIINIKFRTEDDTKRWRKSYDKLVVMIDQKFGGERGELRKEFKVAVHTEEELRLIVKSERIMEEFLK
ncbi:MAG: hypothetical protein ABIG93_02380 [archaeon]|nr:hypothetical protein [Nanoarchaeota archaeon]